MTSAQKGTALGASISMAQVLGKSTLARASTGCAEEQEAELELYEPLLARAMHEHFDTNCVHFNLTLGHSEKE